MNASVLRASRSVPCDGRRFADVLTAMIVLVHAVANAAPSAPNSAIFFNDDQGYRDVGCFGSPSIETPRLDRMATEGRLR